METRKIESMYYLYECLQEIFINTFHYIQQSPIVSVQFKETPKYTAQKPLRILKSESAKKTYQMKNLKKKWMP